MFGLCSNLGRTPMPLVIVLAILASSAVHGNRAKFERHFQELSTNSTEGENVLPILLGLIIAGSSIGSGGAAAAAAMSMEGYFNSTDAPKMFSYMHLSRAQACMPEDASQNDYFYSTATHRSHSIRKCSLCRSFTQGLSEIEVNSSWFGWMLGSGKTSQGDLSSIACANMSREIFGLQSECEMLGRSLLQEVPELHAKLAAVAGSKALRSRFAAHASCEDLQCCPQDPFVAQVVADVAVESLKRPEDVNTVERLGVVGGMLGAPDVVERLGENLKYLQLQQHKAHAQPPRHLMIQSDKECTWNYGRARCNKRKACKYQYKLGDLTLDQSCRLKPEFRLPPRSDEDCQRWDYEEMSCLKSEFCSRQCRPIDKTLHECCRLIRPKTPVTEEGNCAGKQDLDVMAQPTMSTELAAIAQDSFNIWKMHLDAKKYFPKLVKLGLSGRCASCFFDISTCTIEKCFKHVAISKTSQESKACLTQHCDPAFLGCTGVDRDSLPK